MKKITLYGLMLVLLLVMCSSSVFASESIYNANQEEKSAEFERIPEEFDDGEIGLNYVATQIVRTGFTIQSGTAICTCRVTPKTTTSITSINGTFRIINGSGKIVKTYSQTMTKSNGLFYFSANYKLPAKGTYYMKATLVCYKNGAKQETITRTTDKKTY